MFAQRPAKGMHTLERIILATAVAWEQEVAHGEIRPIIGAVDETFLQRMMLVFMDLASGYLLQMEEVAVDRTYDTWHERHQRAPQDIGHRGVVPGE